ncbi:GAK system ATP-grasp enzyme [candidate division WOR-3 bacterium]|nr:GAK system ATP-grasp enzyme [candidate division WOR-3 bacterium]
MKIIKELKIAVVGIPGAWSSEVLSKEIEKKTGFRLLIDMSKVYHDSEKKSIFYDGIDLLDLDALIVKKIGPQYNSDTLERIELLSFLDQMGLKIFSKPQSIITCFDRLSATLKMVSENIPVPPTIITEDLQTAVSAVNKFGKVVLKPLFTSKARGMVVLSSKDDDLPEKISCFKNSGNQIMYIQKFINFPGKDYGIVFLGGEYIGSYARVRASESWNTTTFYGGKYEIFYPEESLIELAAKAQSLFNLDFTCIDIAISDGQPFVFEVSAFGGFKGLFETQKLNAADRYSDYVIKTLRSS